MSGVGNPSAFPRVGEGFGNPAYDEPGMTLRDWFAGQALAAIAQDYGDECEGYRNAVSKRAYMLADAMLAERRQVQP